MVFSLQLKGVSLPDGMTSEMLVQAAARGVSNALQRHFRARNASARHREGFPRSNYWSNVADSVQTIPHGPRATVLIDHVGVALHWKGGTVRPTTAKALAIPLAPKVADINPREFDPGRTLCRIARSKGKGKAAVLVEKDSGTALWLLLRSAPIKPDPSVIPPESALLQAGLDAVGS